MRISDWSSDVCSSDLGYTDDALDRPIIGIVDTASGYNACHRNVPDLIEAASRGVMLAGGIPVPFPVISIQESFTNPTSMYLRNLMAMDAEEMIRAQPIDRKSTRLNSSP